MEPDILGFRIDFETDSGKNFLILNREGLNNNEIIGFQVEMIAKNRILGVAGLNVRETDLEISLWYDISGLVTISNFFRRQKVRKTDFISILKNITTTLIECKNYLLNDRFFILDENVVYINPESLETSLVYIPCERKTELTDTFRKFAVNLVINSANIDTTDNFVQILLQEIKKDDFCLEGFRRNLDKLKRDKVSGDGKSYVLNQEIETALQPKPEVSLPLDTSITTRDKDNQKPTPPQKTNSSGNGFYLFMIIASLLVLAAVNLKNDYLNLGILTGRNIPVGIGVVVLILAVMLGPAIYLKLREHFGHKDCQSVSTKGKLNGQNEILQNGCPDHQVPAEGFSNTHPTILSPMSEIRSELDYTDETVLLNSEKKNPRLVSVSNGETIVINKLEFIIGRNRESCDYAIEHKSVGRAHASIKCENEKYYIVDMDSRNGTYINGTRLVSNKQYELKENDVVVFANVEFYFK